MTTQSLDLNLIPKGISPRLYVSQYDKGQTWTFNIYAGNTAYTIPNGATVTIQGTKPDKTGFQYSCTASGNVVTATEQQQMTVIAGEVSAEIRITNNNEIIATLNFILVVEPAALTDETEISETDLPIIEQAIEMFPHYQEMIDDVSSDIATLSNVRAKLGAHNLFDGYFRNGLLTVDKNYTNRVIDRNEAFPNSEGAVSKYFLFGAYLPAGSYMISVNGSDYVSFNRVAIAGTNCVGSSAHLRPSYAFTSAVEGWNYFSIERDAGESDYSDVNFEGHDLKIMITLATDSDPTYQPYAKTNVELTQGLSEVQDLVLDQGGITTKSFSPVIAVNDALPVNTVDVSAKIEPIQAGSGTPSPSNVRAISGRTEVSVTRAGKNLIEETYVHANIDSTGGLRVESSQDFNICVARVKKGCTYVMSINSTVTMPVYAFYTSKPINGSYSYDGNRIVGGNAYFIAPIDGYIAFRDILNETKTQLELGSTATAYEPYTGNDYTIQLGDTYYGGTLDVTTGVLTVNWKCIDLGTRDWYVAIAENNIFQTTPISDIKIPTTALERKEGIISSNYSVSSNYILNDMDDKSMLKHDNGRLYIRDTSYSDVTTFKTAMSGVQFAYEVETPTTVQLTPQEIQMLQGNNTIFTDSGDTSIQYYANGVKNLEASVAVIQSNINGLANNQFQNECVNLLENKASSAVVDGITFTVNADKSISAYGTLGANSSTALLINHNEVYSNFIGKRLKLSGCPKNTGLSLCRITAYRVESVDGSSGSVFDTGDGVVYEHLNNGTGTRARYQIELYNNTSSAKTVNTTFKPMITLADMPNSDYAHYVPYCKSNRELTDELATNEYVDTNIEWANDASTNFTLTNATKHFRVNKFLRHCIVDVDGVVLKNGWSASNAYPLLATGNNLYNPPYSKRTLVPYFQSGSTWYKMYVSKANSHDGIALTALESIPSGTSLSFTLEWTY